VTRPSQSASHVHPDFEAYISLAGLIDVNAEIVRLEKMMAEKQKQIQSIESKLSNESFVQRAPVEVVAQQRETQADLVSQVKLLAENMVSLKQGN
jgi:valyl-tRNA synthetase